MRIGLIGIGAIGGYLAKNLGEEIVWVCDVDSFFAKRRIKELGLKAKFVETPVGGIDLVVEAASQKAVLLLPACLKFADVMVMSVGALRDSRLLSQLRRNAKRYGRKIYIPSGAVGGLDAVKSAGKELKEVVLETRKNPKAFGRKDGKEVVIFEGNAREACEKFPQSVNVAATLALCGVGFEKTKVRIVSDPKVSRNTHTIRAKGKMGEFEFRVANVPFPENPKTSMLAALAALRVIREIRGELVVG